MARSWESLRKKLKQELEPFGAAAEFCRKSGFSTTSLRRWINNESVPNLDHVDRIADALGYKSEQLISENGRPQPKPHTMEDCYKRLHEAVEHWEKTHSTLLKVAEPE